MITPNGRRLGARVDSLDPRDRRFTAVSSSFMSPGDIEQVDLRTGLPEAYDQGVWNSCTANSGAALLGYLSPFRTQFSRLQVYWDTRVLENSPYTDDGAEVRDVMKVLTRDGGLPESHWPYVQGNLFRAPPQQPLRQKLSSYSRLSSREDFIACLVEGFPFVLTFGLYEAVDSDEVARTGIAPNPIPAERNLGTHAVLVVGYDLSFKKSTSLLKSGINPDRVSDEMLLIRNSWGPQWGDRGHFWLPMDYALSGNDAWTGRI